MVYTHPRYCRIHTAGVAIVVGTDDTVVVGGDNTVAAAGVAGIVDVEDAVVERDTPIDQT